MKARFTDEPITLPWAVLVLFLCLLWGGVAPTIKLSLQGMPPLAIAAWRFLIALACILAFCGVTRTPWRLAPRFYGSLAMFSLIFVAQISLLNVGANWTSSNQTAVLLNTNPLFVALLAHFLIPNDRLTGRKMAGLLLAFAGVCAVFLEPSPASSPTSVAGNALVLASGFLLGVIQVFSKFLVRDLSAFQLVIWEMIYGVPLFFLISALFEREARYNLTAPVLGGVVYQGVLVAAFCFVMWAHLLKRYAASRLSAFQFTTPVFGVALSWVILGDSISPGFAMGVALVAAGIYLVSSSTT